MLRDMAAIAVPIAASNLLANLIGAASSVMIPARLIASGMNQSAALSEYGVVMGMSLPLIGLPSAFIAALALVMIPRLSEDLALKRTASLKRRVIRTLRATTYAIVPSMALLTVFGPRLAELLYDQPAAGAHFPLFAAGTLLSCYQGIMGSLLSGLGEQKRTASTMILTGLIELILIWVLTAQPGLRMEGFGWAFVCSSLAGTALCAWDLWRFFKRPAAGKATGAAVVRI